MLAELTELLNQLQQGPCGSPQGVMDTPNTSGDVIDKSGAIIKSYELEKICALDELVRFSVTRPTDAASKPE